MRLDTATTQHPATATSTLRFINPPGLYDPRANGYTHVVVAPAPARTVFVAGPGGENAGGPPSSHLFGAPRPGGPPPRVALGGRGGQRAGCGQAHRAGGGPHRAAAGAVQPGGAQPVARWGGTSLHADPGAPAGARRHAD